MDNPNNKQNITGQADYAPLPALSGYRFYRFTGSDEDYENIVDIVNSRHAEPDFTPKQPWKRPGTIINIMAQAAKMNVIFSLPKRTGRSWRIVASRRIKKRTSLITSISPCSMSGPGFGRTVCLKRFWPGVNLRL